MTKEQIEMKKALDSAYEICSIVKETMDDIIAGSTIPEKTDIENSKKAGIYIKWYLDKFRNPDGC